MSRYPVIRQEPADMISNGPLGMYGLGTVLGMTVAVATRDRRFAVGRA